MSTDPKRPQIMQNGSAQFIVKGSSLEERFEFLYKNGYKTDLFHSHRKRINGFHTHLCKKQSSIDYKGANKLAVAVWKMIGILVEIDYRTIRDFALHGKNPHKATWKKLKPLLDLLEEKESFQ